MEVGVLRINNESLEVCIEDEEINQENPLNLETVSSAVHHQRRSALELHNNETPASISYNSNAESVKVTNVADGSITLDPPIDPPLSDLDLLLAATYVEDATKGRHSDFKISERHLKIYHLYLNKWGQFVLFVIIGIHLLLALFEKPAVPGLEVSYWITMAVEGFILCFYLFRLAHISVFTPLTRFWSDTKNVSILTMIGGHFQGLYLHWREMPCSSALSSSEDTSLDNGLKLRAES